jgi:hypothetical protein
MILGANSTDFVYQLADGAGSIYHQNRNASSDFIWQIWNGTGYSNTFQITADQSVVSNKLRLDTGATASTNNYVLLVNSSNEVVKSTKPVSSMFLTDFFYMATSVDVSFSLNAWVPLTWDTTYDLLNFNGIYGEGSGVFLLKADSVYSIKLHVRCSDGQQNLGIKLQYSADNSTYYDFEPAESWTNSWIAGGINRLSIEPNFIYGTGSYNIYIKTLIYNTSQGTVVAKNILIEKIFY